MIEKHLIKILKDQFRLDWTGEHGAPHWARVRENGLRLAEINGANQNVIELFAFLHDSQRQNDYKDPQHGFRASLFAQRLADESIIKISDPDLELLITACHRHSDGETIGDITVLTCWDADRLDLGRVGKIPDPARLGTEVARDPKIIEWAYERSIR